MATSFSSSITTIFACGYRSHNATPVDSPTIPPPIIAKSYIFNSISFCDPILDRKSTRLNSSHVSISYAVFCLKKKKKSKINTQKNYRNTPEANYKQYRQQPQH